MNIRVCGVVWAVLTGCGVVIAQEGAAPPVVAARHGVEAGTAALARARGVYKGLRSYRETVSARYVMKLKGMDEPEEHPLNSKAVSSPDRKLAFESDGQRVVSDGTTVWIVSEAAKQYAQRRAAEFDDLQRLGEDLGYFQFYPGPGTTLVWNADAPELLFRTVKKVTGSEARERHGEPGVLVNVEWDGAEQLGVTEPAPGTIWLSDKTGLVGEAVIDMTEQMKRQMNEMKEMRDDDEEEGMEFPEYESAKWIMTVSEAAIDEGLPAETFVFSPPSDYKKVDTFDMPGRGRGEQTALIGEPAPAIKAKKLGGEEFDLGTLRGRVVLLDFWATWCGPCVQAIPEIQKLSERFADKPVSVIGINQDRGDDKKVTRFMEKKKITLTQVMDEDNAIGEAYKVSGIPCMVLIDAKGVVQEIAVGFSPDEAEHLAEKIGKLLDGKDLRTKEEIEELRKAAAEGDDGEIFAVAGGSTGPSPLAEQDAQRLIVGESFRVDGWTNGGTNVMDEDLDGDGLPELVMPGFSGGLSVIAGDGRSAKKVRLRGMANEGINGVRAVPAGPGEGTRWLVSSTKYRTGKSTGAVQLFSAEGERVWRYQPDAADVSANMTADVGDLDGDGKPEVAVGVMFFGMKSEGSKSFMHLPRGGSVIVLDLETGAVRAVKDAGGSPQLVRIVKGKEPAIVCIADGKVTRYRFDPGAGK